MDRKWLEKFYTECGREVSLAYNVLNQTNNWGVTVVTAFVGGVVLSSFRMREEGLVFLYPTYVHWFMVIGAWVALLRFFARSSLALTNMYRWNELIYASSRVLSTMKDNPAIEVYEGNCAAKIDAFYYRFKSPRPKWKIIWHGLKLMYLWFFVAVLVLFGWGLVSLPREWVYYIGVAAFVIATVLEVYWFATWYGMEYERLELGEEPRILDTWKLGDPKGAASLSSSKGCADDKGMKERQMSETVAKNGAKRRERRFSQEQYDMLLRCSKKGDMTEWNEWRKEHSDEEVLLEEADLDDTHLKGAQLFLARLEATRLRNAHLEDANLMGAYLGHTNLREAHLEGANLKCAHLEDAKLCDARLEGANLGGASLKRCDLAGAYLKGAILRNADLGDARLLKVVLEGADLMFASLKGANLNNTSLEGAEFVAANLENSSLIMASLGNASLFQAHIEGAEFTEADLEGTDFRQAIVDGSTLIWKCRVNPYCKNGLYTNFSGVGLDSARIDPGTKQLLEYNIRRMNWEDWYKKHRLLAWLVKPFWWMSDYGMSTLRVVGVFFLLAFLFAAVYMNWGYWRPPGIVSNLVVQPEIGEAVWHYFGRALIRPVYFSIVTMTTLGFGDMYANKGSIAGHVILAVQVILGYVLLGALITRFAVLFTAGGPAGKFAGSRKGPD